MTKLERELASLRQRVLEMGALAESMVAVAAAAIARPDRSLVDRVLHAEPAMDALQVEIDREAIRLITVYSPAAKDLRFLVMVARINSHLERIGDQAVNVCEYVDMLLEHPRPEPPRELAPMSQLALEMLRHAIQALEDEDVHRAGAVMQRDEEMDRIYRQVIRAVVNGDHTSRDELAGRSVGLLVARSLERIADHATNICEEVFYVVEGEDIRHRT